MDRMVAAVNIGSLTVGEGSRCAVIAEAGVNHNGDLEVALDMIDAAAAAGADAVKFQTFNPGDLLSRDSPMAEYQRRATGGGRTQHDMLSALRLREDDHHSLLEACWKNDVIFLSTPFDPDSLRTLVNLEIPAIKIGSGNLDDLPLLEAAAASDRPILLSTGMADLEEVARSFHYLGPSVRNRLVLLHCVSEYPTPPGRVNLRAMDTLRTAFQVPVGFSDHSSGIEVPLAAAAREAAVIEKHFTLDRGMEGPDHAASLEPHELEAMIEKIRVIESAIGDGVKQPTMEEEKNRKVVRKSIALAQDVERGQEILREDLTTLRPGTGLSPFHLPEVIGRQARRSLEAGELLDWGDLD